MKTLCQHSKLDLRVETVPDPEIRNPHDAIVKISTIGICGDRANLNATEAK